MAAISLKEKAVFAGLGVFLLYVLTIAWWFLQAPNRAQEKKKLESAKAQAQRERKTISERAYWNNLYDQEASEIPVLGEGQGADTVWMRAIEDVAASNHVFVSEFKPGKEDVEEWSGDMQKISVDIKWTAAVESLVKFLHALENSSQGKFDVSALSFSPSRRQGFMSGNMTLVCIYKRSED